MLSYTHCCSGDDSLVMNMLQRRTSDNKVAVRKSALQALEALSRLRRNGVLEEVGTCSLSLGVSCSVKALFGNLLAGCGSNS